jgi:hypothetical protein
MAILQALCAVRAIFNPQAARAGNIKCKTIYANLPLSLYRCVGVLCAGAAISFFYLFLKSPWK